MAAESINRGGGNTDKLIDLAISLASNGEFRLVKLERLGDGTLLKLSESGFDALPAARRDELFRRNEGGWAGQMKNIECYVTNNP